MGAQPCKPKQEETCAAVCAVASGPEFEFALPIQPSHKVGNSLRFLEASAVRNTLPKAISPSSIEVIKDTAPLLAPRAEAIAKALYRRVSEGYMDLFEYFNGTNQRSGRQPQALAAALCAFADTVEDPDRLRPALDLIAAKHCALNIQPHHYLTFHEVIMASIEEVMGAVMTTTVSVAWSEAILYLAGMLLEQEEALYGEAKSRNGGWRGFRRFVVTKREIVAQDVMQLTFKPSDARGVYFDFAPGQFVSVKVNPYGAGCPTAPRHYTVTSAPGMPYLQICVKRIQGGQVSNYLHREATDGQEVLLSPPFGTFTARVGPIGNTSAVEVRRRTAGGSPNTAVLISAGIGITPMLALLPELNRKVVMVAHVDKSEETFACQQRYRVAAHNVGAAFQVRFTTESGRPAKDFAAALANRIGITHDFYVCGPSPFMVDVMRSLTAVGVDAERIQFEVFGPQLCPAQEPEDLEDAAAVGVQPSPEGIQGNGRDHSNGSNKEQGAASCPYAKAASVIAG